MKREEKLKDVYTPISKNTNQREIEGFFFFIIQREIELAHYTLATLW